MTRFCECDSEHLISINTRNFLIICVTAHNLSHFYCFHVTKSHEVFPLSVFNYLLLLFAVAYVNHFKGVIASVGCCQWQNRKLPVGNIRDCVGRESVSTGADDPHISAFIDRNVSVIQNYLWSPKWIWNITSVHLHHSHFPSKVTKIVLYITSSALSANCVQYVFYIWSFWFCQLQLCEIPVHSVLKVTVQRLYSYHRDTQLYLQLVTSRELQWGIAPVLGVVIHRV